MVSWILHMHRIFYQYKSILITVIIRFSVQLYLHAVYPVLYVFLSLVFAFDVHFILTWHLWVVNPYVQCLCLSLSHTKWSRNILWKYFNSYSLWICEYWNLTWLLMSFSLWINTLKRFMGLPLWSSGERFWQQIQSSRVRFLALPDFLRSSRSGSGSTQPCEDNWGAAPV
jgi:hypothetical protein